MEQLEDWAHLCLRCQKLSVAGDPNDSAFLWSATIDVSSSTLKAGQSQNCSLCKILATHIPLGQEFSPLAMWPRFTSNNYLSDPYYVHREVNFVESWTCVAGEILLFADEGKFIM